MLCGIDEAGRGPLAGDLVMAGCILHKEIPELNDSKKLSPKKREKLFDLTKENASYHIVKFSAREIDEQGISACLRNGLQSILQNLQASRYLFDGNSSFGVQGLETMVKADATVPEVSAASILAKVTHDRDILEIDKLYPQYGFAAHKGYGTAHHIKMIQKHGYCDIHRRTYKIKALQPTLF
jgi:ribonuclease HII